MKTVLDDLKNLPEGSTLNFIDEDHNPVNVDILVGTRLDGGKDVSIMLRPNYKPKAIYDIKLLSEISILSAKWESLKEEFFRFACEKSEDERWQDPDFRKHMYHQYVNTDRPITDQLYNLDRDNLRTLFGFCKEYIGNCDAECIIAL